jgi:hypothetical protein
MASDLTLPAHDPSTLGWPPSLPLELALRERQPHELCAAYGISRDEWARLRADPLFQAAVGRSVDQLKQDGMGFKLKAQLQSEGLLQESWRLIHDPDTPANVRAELIKTTWKYAGYEPEKASDNGPTQNAFVINLNLS